SLRARHRWPPGRIPAVRWRWLRGRPPWESCPSAAGNRAGAGSRRLRAGRLPTGVPAGSCVGRAGRRASRTSVRSGRMGGYFPYRPRAGSFERFPMSDQPAVTRIRVEALQPAFAEAASRWAERLGLPLDGEAEFAVQLGEEGLQLVELGPQAPGPVRVDFVEGAVAHRRLFGGGSGQMIAKAVGVQPGVRPHVLDATAGLGRDAFVLASLGCEMDLIERQPIIAALLEDGLRRAQDDAEVAPIAARLRL